MLDDNRPGKGDAVGRLLKVTRQQAARTGAESDVYYDCFVFCDFDDWCI